MSAFFSNSLAVALPSLLSSCFISAALSTSQVGRLVDWLVGQTFNSENREFLARSHAKKSASPENSRRSTSSTSTRAWAEGYNSIQPNRGELRLSQWLAQPRAGKLVNFPALLSIVLRAAREKENSPALESETVGRQ